MVCITTFSPHPLPYLLPGVLAYHQQILKCETLPVLPKKLTETETQEKVKSELFSRRGRGSYVLLTIDSPA